MLSQKAKYAIKALTYLAGKKRGEPVKTNEIAKAARIPKKFLEHILLDLKNASLVSSKQGVMGGYYLLKEAEQINLADIYRLFDGAVALLPCASYRFFEPCIDCDDVENCVLRNELIEVKKQTLIALKKVTIKSLSDKKYI
ncbi:MAG TPA: Rrf2 family transcriptional regulator [Cyclobacteriaceae bacterium]|nr:Rrf2 family transcriptional regulator [Cyclobacteriaceae bacterium]